MKRFRSSIFLLITGYWLLATLLYSQSGWGPDTRLVFMQGGGWYPRAACCGDTIHLVWYQRYSTTGPHEEVFYKRSTDAGVTWGEDVMLSVEDEHSSIMPIIACNGERVYVLWGENPFGVLFRRSTNGGTTWEAIDSIFPGESYQDIFVLGDTIFIAGGRNPGDIIFRTSTDGGITWLPMQVVGYGAYVRQAISSPLVGFVYQVTRYCQEIMFKRSTDKGVTWPDSMIISHYDSLGSQSARITVDTAVGFHITWYDYKYSPYAWTGDIFYRASRDSGNTWEEIDSLTVMHRAIRSDILAEGSNLHLVWEDDRNGFDENFEIYYRMSTDLGRTWLPEERLTNAPYHSMCPSLACGGGYLHLFWRDCRDSANNGIGFIYYKRKDLSIAISEFHYQDGASEFLTVSPNPFKEKTLITFFLPNASGILEVYNVSGCSVFKKGLSGKGRKEVLWQADRAGVYFIRLRTIDKIIIKKVVAFR